MRETFPITKKGDRLTHEHVNSLSAVCRRLSGNTSGSYGSGVISSIQGKTNSIPFQQELVKVVDDADLPVYKIRVMYYDASTNSWSTSDAEFDMIAPPSGGVYSKGDYLLAFYHQQSGFFLPVFAASTIVLRVGKAKGVISAGAVNGIVTIWENGVATTIEQTDVRHDWMTNGTAIANNTEIVIGYFSSEGFWRIIGAACP